MFAIKFRFTITNVIILIFLVLISCSTTLHLPKETNNSVDFFNTVWQVDSIQLTDTLLYPTNHVPIRFSFDTTHKQLNYKLAVNGCQVPYSRNNNELTFSELHTCTEICCDNKYGAYYMSFTLLGSYVFSKENEYVYKLTNSKEVYYISKKNTAHD